MADKQRDLGRYIWERPQSRYFWFRMAVPERYRHAAGSTKIQESLKTSDLKEARELAKIKAGQLLARWRGGSDEEPRSSPSETLGHDIVRSRFRPSRAEIEEVAVAIGFDVHLFEAERRRRDLLTLSPSGFDIWKGIAADDHLRQARFNAAGQLDAVEPLADEAIAVFGFEMEKGSEEYRHLCEGIARARFAATELENKRASGDLEAETGSPLVGRVREREAGTAKPGELIMDFFELWAEDRVREGKKRLDTVTQDRKVVALFSQFVGESRAINSITAIEVAEFRETLKKLPPKWMSKRELRNLPIRDAASKAREFDMPRMRLTNVNKYLSTISPLYAWIAGQPKWAGLVNPCNGLLHKGVKGQNRRPAFSTETLNSILRSPLFAGFESDGREHICGETLADDWRKWIPLICMFTGARIGEIAQLRITEICLHKSFWFFCIRHDSSQNLSTKNGKSRMVPMHSKLRQMGLLRFLQSRQKAAGRTEDEPLFPELRPNSRGNVGGKPSMWWREYLKQIGLKFGADGIGAHSFRHTIADRLRTEAELIDNEIAILLGHDQKTTTGGYGGMSQGTARMLSEWIEGVTFEDVDFAALSG